MSQWKPEWAMVFAAGRGKRMMPLTDDLPKPMLEVAGKPMLGHALDHVAKAGINNVVVNAHHRADTVARYLPTRQTPKNIVLSHEAELLETGGGVRKALQDKLLATSEPFLAVNGDIMWTDGPSGNTIHHLCEAWQKLGEKVDALLLVVPRHHAWGHDCIKGDYTMKPRGELTRLSSPDAPFVYTGLQIIRPQLYADPIHGVCFSNVSVFDAAERKGRLYGLVHDGSWFHFSTPVSIEMFENARPDLVPA